MLHGNVLICAHRPESPGLQACLSWLSGILAGQESAAVSDDVWADFLRAVTHPKVFGEPTPLQSAPLVTPDRGFARFEELPTTSPI